MAGVERHRSVKFAQFRYNSEASTRSAKTEGESNYQQQRLSEDWPFWCCFFGDAGFSAAEAATLAAKFVENRIRQNMIAYLTREYLLDMGITRVGDIITILRQAKVVHEKMTEDVGSEPTMGALGPYLEPATLTNSGDSAAEQGKSRALVLPSNFNGCSPVASFYPLDTLERSRSPCTSRYATRSSAMVGLRPNQVVRFDDDRPIGGHGCVQSGFFEAGRRTSTPNKMREGAHSRQPCSRSKSLRQASVLVRAKAAVTATSRAVANRRGCGRSSTKCAAKPLASRSASASACARPIVDLGRLASVQTRASQAKIDAIREDRQRGRAASQRR